MFQQKPADTSSPVLGRPASPPSTASQNHDPQALRRMISRRKTKHNTHHRQGEEMGSSKGEEWGREAEQADGTRGPTLILLTATTFPSSSVPLYTLLNPPSPRRLSSSKSLVAAASSGTLKRRSVPKWRDEIWAAPWPRSRARKKHSSLQQTQPQGGPMVAPWWLMEWTKQNLALRNLGRLCHFSTFCDISQPGAFVREWAQSPPLSPTFDVVCQLDFLLALSLALQVLEVEHDTSH